MKLAKEGSSGSAGKGKTDKKTQAKKVTKAAASKVNSQARSKKVTKDTKVEKARKVTKAVAAKNGNQKVKVKKAQPSQNANKKTAAAKPAAGKQSGKKANTVEAAAKVAKAASSKAASVEAAAAKAKKSPSRKAAPKHAPKHAAATGFDWRIIPLVLFALFLAGIIALMIYVGVIISNTPKIDADNIYTLLPQSSKVYDRKNKEILTLYVGENRTNVKYEDIPENLVNAFVALEDKTFWKHHGFNIVRILGAITEKLTGSSGSIGGTSTITQQLARNVYLKDTMSERSMKRKIREAWYAIQIEHSLTKEEIMEAYLNTVYLGFNSNGVSAAARAYFNKKNLKKLSLAQCATLASLVKSPSELAPVQIYSSSTNLPETTLKVLKTTEVGTFVLSKASTPRRKLCLDLMLDQGYITQKQHDKAYKARTRKFVHPNYAAVTTQTNYFTDYVVTKVIKDLQDKHGLSYDDAYNKVYKGGLKIYTTYNPAIQKIITNAFNNDANYPSPTSIMYNTDGDMLNKKGTLIMYKYGNLISDRGNLVLPKDEGKIRKDGSLVIYANKRLKIYKTEVNGSIDFSIELPTMYQWKDNKLYSINGGFVNIPQQYKTRSKYGNIIVSSDYMKLKDTRKMIYKGKNGGVVFTKDVYTLAQRTIQPQSAMTVIENKTGYVLAMVGGRKQSGRMVYNRAVETRQPGSSIKPLAVYSAALQQSAEEAHQGKKHTYVDMHFDKQGTKGWGSYITASSYVGDEPMRVNGRLWPKNAGGGYSGKNTLRTAIKKSINTCAVKICAQVGVDYSSKMVKKYGISSLVTEGAVSDMNFAALALGGMTHGVSTLEMANAYTAFPNGGIKTKEPICYKKVVDSNGEVLLSSDSIAKKRVLDPGVAFIMVDLMKGVVQGGTGTAAAINGVQVAGKTGTTSDEYDLWFDGYTPKYTASLWMGNDINIRLSGMSGYAAGLWGRIMAQVPGITEGSYKDTPDDIIRIGNEYYVKGTEVGRSTYYADLEKKEKAEKKKKAEAKARAIERAKAQAEKKAKRAARKKAAAKKSSSRKSSSKKSSGKSKKKK